MIYSTLVADFYDVFGDSAANPYYATAAQVSSWVNAACRRACREAGLLEKNGTIVVTSGVMEYTLPSDCEMVTRVAWNGQRLDPVHRRDLLAADDAWESRTGTPYCYYWGQINTPAGSMNKIGLFPAPNTSTTVNTTAVGDTGAIIDPGAHDSEYGMVLFWDDESRMDYDSDYGGLGAVYSGDMATIYYRALPADVSGDDELPVPAWASNFVLWSALADAYEADTQLKDLGSARAYRILAEDTLRSLRSRSFGRSPKIHVLKPMGDTRSTDRLRRGQYPQYIEVTE